MTYQIIIGVIVVALALWVVGSYLVIRNIEQPKYSVVEVRDGYEIRQYDSYIVAETEVTGDYDQVSTEGFRIIADYIFGNNSSRSDISMTAPVLQSDSEKIAMTVPVLNTDVSKEVKNVSFVLPSKYTLDTLPVPNNDQVNLREVPARKVAVLRFSWYATEGRVSAKQKDLLTMIERDELTISGPIQSARYNPPLSMPLLLRNEILVEVE